MKKFITGIVFVAAAASAVLAYFTNKSKVEQTIRLIGYKEDKKPQKPVEEPVKEETPVQEVYAEPEVEEAAGRTDPADHVRRRESGAERCRGTVRRSPQAADGRPCRDFRRGCPQGGDRL